MCFMYMLLVSLFFFTFCNANYDCDSGLESYAVTLYIEKMLFYIGFICSMHYNIINCFSSLQFSHFFPFSPFFLDFVDYFRCHMRF